MAARKTRRASVPDASGIVGQLEEDIALGRMMPRERLIEEELALRFRVNRHVVRQALTELESMGLITRQRNKGATIRDVSPADVMHIYAVRELLEGKAAELIPLPPDPKLLAELKDIQLRHSAAAKAGQAREVFRLNLRFHKTFFAACGNPQLASAIQDFAMRAHLARSLTIADPLLLQRAVAEHAQIIAYMEKGDRAGLVRLAVEHILPSRDAYLESYRRRFGD